MKRTWATALAELRKDLQEGVDGSALTARCQGEVRGAMAHARHSELKRWQAEEMRSGVPVSPRQLGMASTDFLKTYTTVALQSMYH